MDTPDELTSNLDLLLPFTTTSRVHIYVEAEPHELPSYVRPQSSQNRRKPKATPEMGDEEA